MGRPYGGALPWERRLHPARMSFQEVTDVDVKTEPDLIDQMVEMYVDWREECLGLSDAYGRWLGMPVEDRVLAFASYQAALDREEQASAAYASQIERIRSEAGG
jgi:hypothetical protein